MLEPGGAVQQQFLELRLSNGYQSEHGLSWDFMNHLANASFAKAKVLLFLLAEALRLDM